MPPEPDAASEHAPDAAPAPVPARLSADGSTATWNPAMAPDGHVVVRIRTAAGDVVKRRSLNSGRARVRPPERIEAILPAPPTA